MQLLSRITAAMLLLGLAQTATAAELKVLSIPGVKGAFDELVPQFERAQGHKVAIRYEIYAGQTKEIEAGDFDVAVFGRPQMEEMSKQGRIAPASIVDMARTSIGVAVREGASRPDIATEEAFKRTLLAAKSIAYTRESLTGRHVTRLLERLGLTEAVKDKLKPQPGGGMTTPAVARGEAEIGIVLVSDILATPGVHLVGPLPESLQNYVMQTAAIGARARQPAEGEALIAFLSAPAAFPVFKSKGLEPPR